MADSSEGFEHTVDVKSSNRAWFSSLETNIVDMTFEPSARGKEAMAMVDSRLEEIAAMTRPSIRDMNELQELTRDFQTLLEEMKLMDNQQFREKRRKEWKLVDRLRYSMRMVLLLVRATYHRKKYVPGVISQWVRFEKSTKSAATQNDILKEVGQGIRYGPHVGMHKSFIGWELQMFMSMQPEYRSPVMLKRIIWLLKATNAFSNLFPDDMAHQLAKHVSYEKYENGRVIAHQQSQPQRFYFIIAGRVEMLKTYQLTSGEVIKSLGFLKKGQTTDLDEIENQYWREYQLVSKGQTELLSVELSDFLYLRSTNSGLPLKYLKTLYLFRDYPLETFKAHPKSLTYKYFEEDKVVCKDMKHSPWFFVIKSGHCRVVRKQHVVDVVNDRRFVKKKYSDQIGLTRAGGHATDMLDRDLKDTAAVKSITTLPKLEDNQSGGENIEPWMKDIKPSHEIDELNIPVNVESRKAWLLKYRTSQTQLTPNKEICPTDESVNTETAGSVTASSDTGGTGVDGPKSEALSSLREDVSDDDHSTERSVKFITEVSGQPKPRKHKKNQTRPNNNSPVRNAYLQIGLLSTDEIYGLNDIYTSDDNAAGVALISDGCEIIMMHKRIFLMNCENETLLKLTKMYHNFVTEDEAKTEIENKDTWKQYKSLLIKKIAHEKKQKKDNRRR